MTLRSFKAGGPAGLIQISQSLRTPSPLWTLTVSQVKPMAGYRWDRRWTSRLLGWLRRMTGTTSTTKEVLFHCEVYPAWTCSRETITFSPLQAASLDKRLGMLTERINGDTVDLLHEIVQEVWSCSDLPPLTYFYFWPDGKPGLRTQGARTSPACSTDSPLSPAPSSKSPTKYSSRLAR